MDAIVVEGVGKRFRRFHAAERPALLKEALLRGFRGLRRAEHFWSLRDVSFRVAPGSALGIVGRNGAGKSTLLRLVGGVGRPDAGTIHTRGRIHALLDLGLGFQVELTGRENVFVSGVLHGLTRREVAARLDAIVAFAELEDAIDSPLRTYSTGMQMRLAFAVAAHTEPEILLVDEVLAVGDLAFQRKCLGRIEEFKAAGCAILLASHDARLVQRFCDEALWLREGCVVAHGPAEVVVGQYVAEMTAETRRRTPAARPPVATSAGVELRVNENRFGSLEVEIGAVRLLDARGLATEAIATGAGLAVEMEYHASRPVDSPIFGLTLTREDGFVCYDTSIEAAALGLRTLRGEGCVALRLDRLDLGQGLYYVDVGVYKRDWAYAYDYHWHVYPLAVQSPRGEKGIVDPPGHWEVIGLRRPAKGPPGSAAPRRARR